MRIVLFCENKYAVDILLPIYQEAVKSETNHILWYVHLPKIPVFPLDGKVVYTYSMQEVYDFSPEAIFVPGNIVPYYLPGVKIQVFHGYAAEKKDHWVIRRYFDTYFTQGPFLPALKEALLHLVKMRDVVLLLKLHPLTKKEWVDEYKQLAEQEEHIIWEDGFNVTKYQLMSDVMISDTSSTVYEFLLLGRPVITYRTIAKDIYWTDITDTSQLTDAFESVQHDENAIAKRRWVVDNYDPYLDGNVARRMLEAAEDYIRRHGVPRERKLNLWRKYTSIKTFGRIKK